MWQKACTSPGGLLSDFIISGHRISINGSSIVLAPLGNDDSRVAQSRNFDDGSEVKHRGPRLARLLPGRNKSKETRMTEEPSPRRTRQSSRKRDLINVEIPKKIQPAKASPSISIATKTVKRLPEILTSKLTGLGKQDLNTLAVKQRWLRQYKIELPDDSLEQRKAADATLVFAQEEAGTAICISATGLLLTCTHCVAEDATELEQNPIQYLLFASGTVCGAKCIAWDTQRDLALLQITESQPLLNESLGPMSLPFMEISRVSPRYNAPLACIGHPGSEDLETSVPGIKTNYDVLHVSTGKFRGYTKGQDLQDNSEIGALKHDYRTYWGHSGAPLIDRGTGRLVGLHSSWDDSTGMRRGAALEAILRFLQIHAPEVLVIEV